jgi:hypothetical protein
MRVQTVEDYDTCFERMGRITSGHCNDTLNPCDVGACCYPTDGPDRGRFCEERPVLRGSCPLNDHHTFYEGETCAQTCKTIHLGACCKKATPSSAPSCTMGTYKECVGDQFNPVGTFLGFAHNKTCDEVDCTQYGACCSSDRKYNYKDGMYSGNITWSCSPGCLSREDGATDNKWADFVQGSTCTPNPASRLSFSSKSCLSHVGACCFARGANRMCIDQVSRKACSNRPSYVSFHVGATCKSVGNCTTTSYGACMSPPRYQKYGRYMWSCIAGDSEAMCFARQSSHFLDWAGFVYWFPQHAPGQSCLGFNTGNVATTNYILRQRGACWSLNETTGVQQCNNNMPRSECMAKPGFLGFNASKACTQTRTVSDIPLVRSSAMLCCCVSSASALAHRVQGCQCRDASAGMPQADLILLPCCWLEREMSGCGRA